MNGCWHIICTYRQGSSAHGKNRNPRLSPTPAQLESRSAFRRGKQGDAAVARRPILRACCATKTKARPRGPARQRGDPCDCTDLPRQRRRSIDGKRRGGPGWRTLVLHLGAARPERPRRDSKTLKIKRAAGRQTRKRNEIKARKHPCRPASATSRSCTTIDTSRGTPPPG